MKNALVAVSAALVALILLGGCNIADQKSIKGDALSELPPLPEGPPPGSESGDTPAPLQEDVSEIPAVVGEDEVDLGEVI